MVKQSGVYDIKVKDGHGQTFLSSGLHFIELQQQTGCRNYRNHNERFANIHNPETGDGMVCRLSVLNAMEREGKLICTAVKGEAC